MILDAPTQPQKNKITPQQARSAAAAIGFLVMVTGLAGFDWRIAAVVSGASIVSLAIVGTIRANTSRKGP